MPLQRAQDYFHLYDDVLKPGMKNPGPDATDEQIDAAYMRVYQATAIEIFIDDPDNIALMRDRLQKGAGRPLILTDWQQRNETFFSALQVERVVMFTILSMIVVVAAFNIISSLVMLVKDKGADIAVLRTMGATRGSIMRIFSMTGTAIGVAGTIVGFILGITIALNAETLRAFVSNLIGVKIFPPEVFFLSALPSKIDPVEVTAIVVVALGLSFLATIYPAWRAAQYDPVEALRYE
jgi:lipoprotein-releasing system permease protein